MSDTKIDPKKLRNVAGAFATGITIVCVEDNDNGIHGMTANSFLSVSLDPPLVLFSVNDNAKILEYLSIGKRVGISILCDDQKLVSNQFAGFNEEDIEIEFSKSEDCHLIKDAMAWYSTSVHEIIQAGDHYLILCNVLDLDRDENKSPILYYSGYKSIGNNI